MSCERFDLVVIGCGPAGQKGAVQAAKAGARVLVVDKQRMLGGECVHRGTIPSKTLHASASSLLGVQRFASRLFDSDFHDKLQVEVLMERLDDVRSSHARFMAEQLERNGIERWQGRARFVGPHELVVRAPDRSERHVHAERVLIATGSRPRTPDNVPVDHEHVLDSDSVLSLIYLPKSLTVLGGGVIACEYASIFAALGVSVTMVDRGERPLGFMDEELVQHFLGAFERLGGTFLAERNLESVRYDGVSSVVTKLDTGEVLRAEKMLCALGRVTCASDLGLDAAGVELGKRGLIPVDDNYRTAVPHILAAGDAIGPPALAASAMEQGRIAVRAAFGLEVQGSRDMLPIGIYTIPEMGSVGKTEAAAREEHGDVLVGRAPFAELARAQITGDTEGVLKLVASPDGGKILGVHAVGQGASELVAVGQMAMIAGLGPEAFIENTFNFPTMAEGYRVAALQIVQAAPRLRRAS